MKEKNADHMIAISIGIEVIHWRRNHTHTHKQTPSSQRRSCELHGTNTCTNIAVNTQLVRKCDSKLQPIHTYRDERKRSLTRVYVIVCACAFAASANICVHTKDSRPTIIHIQTNLMAHAENGIGSVIVERFA